MTKFINGLDVIEDYKRNLEHIKSDKVLKNMDEYHMYNLALEATKAEWVNDVGNDLINKLVDILNYPMGDFLDELPSALNNIAEAIEGVDGAIYDVAYKTGKVAEAIFGYNPLDGVVSKTNAD